MSIENGEHLRAIDHVNIVVDNLEAATEFFEELGFTKTGEGDLSGEWVDAVVGLEGVDARFVAMALPAGQTALELLSYKHPLGERDPNTGKSNQVGIRHIAFRVDRIDDWYKRLIKSGIECLSPVQDVPNYRGKRMFYFRGPEGVLLELAEYPDEQRC